jgi:hypothetical protein
MVLPLLGVICVIGTVLGNLITENFLFTGYDELES